jgi:hypothetical protein
MISKEFFIECIEAIRQDQQYRIKFFDTMAKLLDDGGGWPKCYKAEMKLIEWLQNIFKDDNAHSVIEYFIYELDFGLKNEDYGIYDQGVKVPLSNAGELYDYLIKNMEKK